MVELEISLISNTFYPIRNLYPGYDKIDYENIGGMVIMPLTNNHLILESFSNSRNLQKYNTLEGKIQDKLVIVNVMKGSKMAENDIIQPPLIIDKVNGSDVRNMKDLRKAFNIINSKNDRKYISFLTENHKFFMLDLQETLKEEEFLSQKLGYSITKYTNKLLTNTNVTNPINQEVISNALKEDPDNILQNSNNMKKDIYSLMVNTPVILSPTPTPSESIINTLIEENSPSPSITNNNLVNSITNNNLTPSITNNNLTPSISNLAPSITNNNAPAIETSISESSPAISAPRMAPVDSITLSNRL